MTDGPDTTAGDEAEVLFDESSILAGLQDELEHVDQVELSLRPGLLERANAALVQALGDLEEV